ncbi:MAG: hypothetical protein BWY77_01827 [bacterium ADurb.Bin431]|nr:MAG: hypothetical protein BWY77_01827 [bacterium ADurb.Bin431]
MARAVISAMVGSGRMVCIPSSAKRPSTLGPLAAISSSRVRMTA